MNTYFEPWTVLWTKWNDDQNSWNDNGKFGTTLNENNYSYEQWLKTLEHEFYTLNDPLNEVEQCSWNDHEYNWNDVEGGKL